MRSPWPERVRGPQLPRVLQQAQALPSFSQVQSAPLPPQAHVEECALLTQLEQSHFPLGHAQPVPEGPHAPQELWQVQSPAISILVDDIEVVVVE